MRILTQYKVTNDQVEESRILINSFMQNFENLYGRINCSYSMHCNLHLPDQVLRFGSIHKLSCFPFEGVFKECNNMFSGTKNIFLSNGLQYKY